MLNTAGSIFWDSNELLVSAKTCALRLFDQHPAHRRTERLLGASVTNYCGDKIWYRLGVRVARDTRTSPREVAELERLPRRNRSAFALARLS